jgi:cold shock CspA family protein
MKCNRLCYSYTFGVRLTGTVKWSSAKKGFGFIASKVKDEKDAEEQEVFVHQTSILGGEDGRSFRMLVSAECRSLIDY